LGLAAVLMRVSVFSHVACRDAPNGLDAASTAYEKLLSFRFVGTHELPSFNTAKSCSPNKPKSNANRQKKNKNHFIPI
jgi:hypothetical protein